MPSRWSDVLGVIWIPSTIPSHFFAETVFSTGLRSGRSFLLEPGKASACGLPSGLVFQAPSGFPSTLVLGHDAITALDRFFNGLVREVAVMDPFGRPCVEALAPLRDILDKRTAFASPIFDAEGVELSSFETRRIMHLKETP